MERVQLPEVDLEHVVRRQHGDGADAAEPRLRGQPAQGLDHAGAAAAARRRRGDRARSARRVAGVTRAADAGVRERRPREVEEAVAPGEGRQRGVGGHAERVQRALAAVDHDPQHSSRTPSRHTDPSCNGCTCGPPLEPRRSRSLTRFETSWQEKNAGKRVARAVRVGRRSPRAPRSAADGTGGFGRTPRRRREVARLRRTRAPAPFLARPWRGRGRGDALDATKTKSGLSPSHSVARPSHGRGSRPLAMGSLARRRAR